MAFSLPVFNISFNYWFPGVDPSTHPPSTGTPGQLYVYSRYSGLIGPGLTPQYPPEVIIRVPVGWLTAVNAPYRAGIFSFTDVAGIEWFYAVAWWEHMHAYFPNEYVAFFCQQCTDTGSIPDTSR